MEPGMEKRLEQSPLDKRRLADAGAEPSLVSSGRKANSRLPSLLHCRRTLSALYRQRMAGRPVRLRTRFSPGNHLALRTDHVPALDPPAPLLRMKKTSPLSEKLPFREKIPSCGFGRSAPALLHSGPQYPSGLCAPRHPGLVHPDRTEALAMEQPPPGHQTSYLPPSLHIWHHGHFSCWGTDSTNLNTAARNSCSMPGTGNPPVLLGQCPPSLLRSILLIRKSAATGTGNAASGQRNNLSGDETDGLSSAPFPPVRMEAGSGRTALAPAFPPRRPRQRKTRANSVL